MSITQQTPHRPTPTLSLNVLPHLLLFIFLLIHLFPFLWMLGSSLKSSGEFFTTGLNPFPSSLHWENYLNAWKVGRFDQYFMNTVLVACASTLVVTLSSLMAGFALSRTEFPGKTVLLLVLGLLFFLPQGYSIIPLFDVVSKLNLLNSLNGVILVVAAGDLVISITLFIAFFSTLPRELEEAAEMDGASFPVLFLHVIAPQAKPMAATVALNHFVHSWNAFFIPMVFTLGNEKLRTLPVGMRAFVGENSTEWTWVCAGAVMAVIPILILFFLLQKNFVDAIAGAVKG